jgi:membrane protease YdiL (CAAX protease family)
VEAGLKLALWFLLTAVTAWLLVPRAPAAPIEELGLSAGFVRGLTFGALATIPMMVAVGLLDRKSLQQDLVAGSAIIGPWPRRFCFAGFSSDNWSVVRDGLFGRRWCSVRSHSALPTSGTSMPPAHGVAVRVPHDVSSIERAYMAAGALFAWVTYRWNSLWPAIALHGLMNFWWDLTKGDTLNRRFTSTRCPWRKDSR